MREFTSCDECKYSSKREDEFPCTNCVHNAIEHYEPITNADRIRKMTDDELAMLFIEVYSAGYRDEAELALGGHTYNFKWDSEWLKQVAER